MSGVVEPLTPVTQKEFFAPPPDPPAGYTCVNPVLSSGRAKRDGVAPNIRLAPVSGDRDGYLSTDLVLHNFGRTRTAVMSHLKFPFSTRIYCNFFLCAGNYGLVYLNVIGCSPNVRFYVGCFLKSRLCGWFSLIGFTLEVFHWACFVIKFKYAFSPFVNYWTFISLELKKFDRINY